jgi:hypothetical protein
VKSILGAARQVQVHGHGEVLFSGTILICSSIVPIRSLGDASLSLTNPMSYPFVMIMRVDAISVQRRPLQRFCKVYFIGRPFSKTLTKYCVSCERCQKLGSISRWNMMPLNPILIVEIFDARCIDFMDLS